MKRIVKLTEADLTRIVQRVMNEESEDDMSGNVNRVMDMAYEMLNKMAPDGPRNERQYMSAINQLEMDFNYAIRNLKGNLGM